MAIADLKSTCKHEKYFILGADLFLLVEHVHFCVHRYFFERESVYFRSLLETPVSSDGQPPPGTAVSNALILEEVTADEFALFLWVFYNPRFSLYDEATIDDWSSVLRLSHRWSFPEVKALAVRELQNKVLAPVDRIALYQANGVDRNLLIPAYVALCEREEPLTLDEGLILEMETTLTIARGREEVRAQRSADGVKSPLKPTLHGSELYAAVKDLFTSSINDTTLPPKPTATVTGTDINGHATSTTSSTQRGPDKETNGQKSGGLAAPTPTPQSPILQTPTSKQTKKRERKKTEETTQQQEQKETTRKATNRKNNKGNKANNGEPGLQTPVAGQLEVAGGGGLEEETNGNEENEKPEMNEGDKVKVEGGGMTVGGEGDPKLESDSKSKSTSGGSENANPVTNTTTTPTSTSTTPVQTNPVGADVKTELGGDPQPQAAVGGGEANGTTGTVDGTWWSIT